jgi:hypothetical protein
MLVSLTVAIPTKHCLPTYLLSQGTAAGVVDPVSDGPGSSDEYEPPAGKEDEDERILDPSDDEVAPPPKPAPRKPHKGAARESVRISVEAQRALLAESGAKGKAKRKELPTPEQVF